MKQTTFQSTLPSRGAIMAGTKVIDITDSLICRHLIRAFFSTHSGNGVAEHRVIASHLKFYLIRMF